MFLVKTLNRRVAFVFVLTLWFGMMQKELHPFKPQSQRTCHCIHQQRYEGFELFGIEDIFV